MNRFHRPSALRLGLQLLDHRQHLPALALALLRVIVGGTRPDLLVHERANAVAPLGLGGLKAEIHAAPTISIVVSRGYERLMGRLDRQDRDRHRRRVGHRQGDASSCSGPKARRSSAPTSATAPTFARTRAAKRTSSAWSNDVVADARRARHLLRQCRHFGRLRVDLRAERGGLGRDPAGQPDRAVPRDQICGAADQAARRRLDHLHRERRRAPLGRRRRGLFGVQSGRDQPRPDRPPSSCRAPASASTPSAPA